MKSNALLNQICNCYENNEDELVLKLWEEKGGFILDLGNNLEKEVCDALSHCYLVAGEIEKSLIYINQMIDCRKSVLKSANTI